MISKYFTTGTIPAIRLRGRVVAAPVVAVLEGKVKFTVSALGFVLLFSSISALADGSVGKIYTNGSWVNAKRQEASFAPAASWMPDWFLSKQNTHPLDAAIDFLRKNSPLVGLDSSTNFSEARSQSSPELQTVRLEKFWNGLPVIGGDAVVHFAENQLQFANVDSTPLFGLSAEATISPETAMATAYSSYVGNAKTSESAPLAILLVPSRENGALEAKLVYQVTVRDENHFSSDIHFIDAQSNQEIMSTTNVHTLVRRQISAGLGSEQDFTLPTNEWKVVFADDSCPTASALGASRENAAKALAAGSEPTPCHEDLAEKALASAIAAWNNSGIVHNYYWQNHSRNSIDGKGMTMNSVVNFGGEGFPNAAWYNDKSMMLYGMGDEKVFNDFALPLDVAAHEITHGVTSNTSNLQYVSESGALNESFSDVFGKLVAFSSGKTSDWKLGKDLFKDGSKFIRDMENPEVAHYDQFRYKGAACSRFNDFCGVHSNSGIPNRAAVLLAKRIGLEKLGKLYYLTLTQLLRSNSTFKEARDQTIAACQKLWGPKSSDCLAVSESFAAVGIQ